MAATGAPRVDANEAADAIGDRRLAALRSFADSARGLTDPDAILQAAAKLLRDTLAVELFIYAEAPAGDMANPALFRALDGTIQTAIVPELAAAFGEFATSDAVAATFVVNSNTEVPVDSPIRIAAEAMGMHSGINVPLVRDGRHVAGFSCLNRRERVWTRADVELCEELAELTWASVKRARAEADSAEREARFRTLAENIPAMCWLGDSQGNVNWMNGAAEAFFGPIGLRTELTLTVHPDDTAEAEAAWTTALRDGTALAMTVRLRGASDEYRLFRSSTAPILDAAGAVAGWCGTMVDLSDREAHTRRQAALRAFHDATRDLTDARAILAALSDLLPAFLGTTHFLYFDLAADVGERLELLDPAIRDQLAELGPARLDEAVEALSRGADWHEPRVVHDNRLLERAPDDAVSQVAAKLGLRAGVNVPIIKDGALVAVLCILDIVPRQWTAEDVALCQELADRLWAAVSRARAEAALQERERTQAFLIDWNDRVRDLSDVDEIIAETLAALGNFMGAARTTYSEAEAGGRTFAVTGEWCNGVASIAHTRFSLDSVSERLVEGWLGGEALRYDDVANDPSIARTMRTLYAGADIAAFLTVPLIEGGEARSAISVQHDRPRHWRESEVALLREVAERTWIAIERTRAESELQERERAQAFLISWTDATRGLTEGATIIATTLERVAAFMGVARVTYSVSDASGRSFRVCGEQRADRVPSLADTHFSLDDVGAQVEREWLSGTIVRYDDIAGDARIEDVVRDAYLGAAIAAFVSIPLIEGGQVRSALSVQHDAPRPWRDSEIQLLRDVADRTWVALERARAEGEVQERERHQAFLIDWSDQLRGLDSVHAITGATLAALGRFLGVARATYAIADEPGVTFTICDEWRDHGPSIAGETFTFEQTGPDITAHWHAGETIRSDDVRTDPAIAPAMLGPYEETGIRAFVSVPVRENDRVRSSLSVQHDQPRAWRDGELRLLREVAERIWIALERVRAQAALQERERSQAFLIDWTDTIREETAPERIVAITLERLGRHFDVTRTTYSQGDAAGQTLINAGEWCDGVGSIAGVVFRMSEVGDSVAQEWLGGGAIHYDDVETDPRIPEERRPFFAQHAVRSLLTVPLIEAGRVRSAVSLQSRKPRSWSATDAALVRDVAERIWVVLERTRAEAELAARERHQAFVIDWSDRVRVETTPDAIVSTTLEWLGRHLGVTRTTYAEADGDALFEVVGEWRDGVGSIHGSRFLLSSVGAAVDRTWRAGEIVRYDDVANDPRLETEARARYAARDIAAFVSAPLVQDGRMQSALSVQHVAARVWSDSELQLVRDIAERTWVALERARAQASLVERERNQAFLVAWSDAVRGEPRARVILERTVRMLREHIAVVRVNYAEPDPRFETLTVLEEDHTEAVVSVRGLTYRVDDFGTQLAADQRSGAIVRVEDTTSDPRFDEHNRALFDRIGMRAALTVPMRRGDEVLAVLSLQHNRARRWTAAEVELVGELADRTLTVLERAQSEARLAESEAQLSAFMQNAPVAMNLCDADGRYIRVNPECARAVDRPVEELTGLMPRDVFPPQIAAQLEALHAQAMAGAVVSAEMTVGVDRRYGSALTIAFPIGDGQGAAKVAGFTIDLSDRKRAEAALQQSRDALYQTEKLTALGSLLAGVSHELNNPLSIVVAQAVMMERQSQGGELAERAQKIRKAADRCARIVQSFLAMARQKRPEREAVDLNAIATAAHELADYGLKNDAITTVRALTPNLPPISADSDQLHQIVINLIVNAQQAMVEADLPNRTLTLRSALGAAPGTVVLDVSDNGPGVPPEVQRRIFEPFYTTKPQGQGTGVGLSFSQGLAEAHGGTLELVPAECGACFRLTLPIDVDSIGEHAASPEALAIVRPKRRALVVDDEAEIAESLADFLSLEAFECEVAIGGAAAKERILAGNYDLIVSDLRMPGVDGPALHAFVAEQRPDLADRLAFATGDTLGQTAARFLAGIDRPVLEKPFTPEAVRRFLEQMDLA